MKRNDPIGFSLISLSTEQFALLEEDVDIKDMFNIQTQIRFGASQENRYIQAIIKFKFEAKDRPFIVLEVASIFSVREEDWDSLINNEKDSIVFPRNFVLHLSILTVGAARGILHAKTENSTYHNILLPTIDVASLVKSDIIISL